MTYRQPRSKLVRGDSVLIGYLDDGSNVPTDPERTGVKVYGTAPGSTYVEVTGISGSETSGDKIIRVIRSTDVQPLGDDPPPPPI